MSEFVTSTLILAAEFGAVISLFFLIYMAFIYIKRKKDSCLMRDFTSKFRESTGARREKLEQSVCKVFCINADEGKGAVNEIMNKERTICSNVLRIFNGQDKSLIMNLREDLDGLSGAYHNLASLRHEQPSTKPVANDQQNAADDADMAATLDVLRTENQRLKEDLKKSLENVDYLQAQYTELFEKTKQ